MITLCLDTCFYHLTIAIIKDDQILDSIFLLSNKNQSEIIFEKIIGLFKNNNLSPKDVEQVVVTSGPGSYTGSRIAMTIAKVFTSSKSIELYTIPTLALYAGLSKEIVIIDARATRSYIGIYNQGNKVIEDQVVENEKLLELIKDYPEYSIYGDGHLIDLSDNFADISSNFLSLKDRWVKVDNIHRLQPEYLKDNNAYGNN